MLEVGGPLLLVGGGKMGGALLAGWIEQGVKPSEVSVVEPNRDAAEAVAATGARVLGAAGMLDADFAPAVVLLAVKPQQMDAVLPEIRRFAGAKTVFLSIAAGKPIVYFEAGLGPSAAVVRAMPNTPAAVGRGMSVLSANDKAGATQRRVCEQLLSAVGEVAWVEDEGLLDAVTAVSGGGPAYVFLLIEALAEAGVEAGLPEDLAMRLARVTVAGAGELVHLAAEPAGKLRENVTSPGGTTLEALKILMAPDGLQPLMTRAIAAATRRSRELAT
ncbi:MAG: pyrroline-5-carboxylate reductase [Rhodospirillales bacterium]|nr:pyrroline-5-carboxylate reductase [Rhodospirillales bacterium]MDH3791827.1 pyrroline-5-carboxylate reductase [Rhodospirillales bacterium]MDH3909711.1 pyrroline-5-carboxylate reductase [Rhodospirillales bacterium]MDH3966040.1 pyrroline-5-carboxylate reductase [Rhodospirillales bacterium]